MNRVGVSLFDDPKNPTSGWASAGGESGQRIRGIGELDSDHIWVTNIDFRDYRKLNLIQSPNIFDQQFFRTSIRQLADEWGLGSDPEQACSVLSRLLSRVARLGESYLGVGLERPGYRYAAMLTDVCLPAYAKKRPSGASAIDLETAFAQATQENQAMVGMRPSYGSKHYSFVFPRGAYARWIMHQRVPGAGPWEPIDELRGDTVVGQSGGQVVRGSKAVLDKLRRLGDESAVILRVSVIATEPFYQGFSSFGVGASYPRAWATLPEVLSLSNYAKLVISGGYKTGYGDLGLGERLDLDSDEYSFSRGLLYENVWIGLCMPIQATHYRTPIGAFLRAYDRFACFHAAEKFVTHNITVGSYGTGRVIVFLRDGEREMATNVAREVGLVPSVSPRG